MITDDKYSCTSELGAEILMVITSFIIAICVLFLVLSSMDALMFESLQIVTRNINTIISDQHANLFLSSAYALFLPIMSYIFSQAKQYYPEERVQQILIWMVLGEIIRVRGDPISAWTLRKSAAHLVRLFWVGFLVYSYAPLHGIRISLFILCFYFSVFEVMKGIIFKNAQNSFLIGKNPKLIHNYLNREMVQDDLQTNPINNCDYIVMGEENHKMDVCNNGYILGKKKSNSEGMLTIGRVFQLNLSEDKAFTSENPYWRDTCLSLALAKMLRQRFAKLPVDEVRSRKALNFVQQGLIDYIGRNQDIPTDRNDGQINPIERVFSIIQEELKFVSDYLHIKVPTYHYLGWYAKVDLIGANIMGGNGIYIIYTICKRNSRWLSVVAQETYNHCFFHGFRSGSSVLKIFQRLDLAITILLVFACIYIQYTWAATAFFSNRWLNLIRVKNYIKDPTKWNRSNSSFPASLRSKSSSEQLSDFINLIKTVFPFKKARVYSSVLDMSIFARFPKWIRKNISRSAPTIADNTDAKEALLRFLGNNDGELTNGETSLKNYGMENLNWTCQPNGSTTESILIWHIATTLFHHQTLSSQENHDSHQVPENNTLIQKKQNVALALSSYCHYLVECLPELLPDDVDWTEDKYESVRKEILAIPQTFCQKPMKKFRCDYALGATWDECSVVGKGVVLANDLIKSAKVDEEKVWTMLADFWAEIILFIAPSDNVDGHAKILEREELITQLWALLTHAGFVTRPKRTRHAHHEVEGDTKI